MKDSKNKKRIFKKIVLSCFIFCVASQILFIKNVYGLDMPTFDLANFKSPELSLGAASALSSVKTDDKGVQHLETKNWAQSVLSWLWEKGWAEKESFVKTAGSKAYYSALSKALNTIAYDTATWIGSGGKGQKPLFITEGWGEYMNNIGDNAAGNFIETLGREGFSGEKFNLCEPDFAVKMKIGLGLLYTEKPKAPACTFSKMKENWDEALRSDDFLTDFQDMFEPESNDLGIALTLQTGIIEDKEDEIKLKIKERTVNKGWLSIRGISDKAKSYPGYAESRKDEAERSLTENLAQYTGDTFVDAINIFLNQLSITAFQNLMKNIGDGKDTSTHPYDWDSLTDFEAGPSNSGVAGAKMRFRELLEPKFNIRGDYDILAELTMCPNPNKAGPTNCVIEDKFRQAIENKVTVGDAIKQGYLNADGIFGFILDELEPAYKDLNYPYRSMIILRKFRIIPVGWELTADYIKDHFNDINGAKSLGELIACYDDLDEYEGYSSAWCKGLVDPNWVLKAPLNYCKREGYGPEIISEEITGEGYDSKLSISRDENYCADEQSCIKENNDGSCEIYGYCTQEKRKWNFNANSCDPNYNTCQTFRSRNGKTVSYLENTLDYGICNIDNVGCQKYSVSSNGYDSDIDTVNWNGVDNMYFDKDVEECDVDSEGCHEFIRTKAGLGVNLLINSSFEENLINGDWNSFGTQNNSDSYIDGNSLELNRNSSYDYIINPILSNYEVGGESFNLSFYAKDCGDNGEIQLGSTITSLNNVDDNWQYFSIFNIYSLGDGSGVINFQINSDISGCKIDGIKLERGNSPTQYSDYRQNGLVYEKLLPDYLEDSCYRNFNVDYEFMDNAPAICNNFVRKCNQDEAGCNMYTSVDDNISIPAKVLAQDYCPAECEGYDNYLQQESVFDSLNPAYFIPKTAQTCGAESAGCDEFTNLDKIEEQGEQIEYYSYLRQCRNPDDQCADFYTWEGSSETGYQLMVFSLEIDDDTDDVSDLISYLNDPAVTDYDGDKCASSTYNLPATDLNHNSDCREFYNTTGDISYHLYKRTISCSDDCHPFRRTRNNIVKNLDNSNISEAECGGLPGSYVNGKCIFCKNGGVWNDQHQSCIYMAIPDEGIQCSSSADGCREYSGNSGNNMRIILNNDFEGGIQNWEGESSANLSNNSLMVGGESLQISGGAHLVSTTIGYLAEQNKAYYLTFIAKTGGEISSFQRIGFDNGSFADIEYFTENPDVSMSISGDWKIYKFNLANLRHKVNDTESLFIQANVDFFIDNIRLIEITDRYYLIKDSWNIPDSCYEDIYGNLAGEIYNLGCSAYSDRDDKIHYLRQFSSLCQESAVGCELMIDTHNYSDYNSGIWNDRDGSLDCDLVSELDCVQVEVDNYIYAAYDQEKECNNNDQGCGRFGKVYEYENDSIYGDIYLKNNSNKYNEILCEEEAIDCSEWISDEGINYFKNPKDQTCEWRQLSGEGENSWSWFKKKIKRCDENNDDNIDNAENNFCLSDGACSTGNSCILDNNDYPCPVDDVINSLKTFGYGGNGNIVYQPTQDLDGYWIGICSANESGCSEYIDPISKFNTNMIFNADFSQDVDNNGQTDGWSENSQNILLKPKKLYTISVNGSNTITVSTNNSIFRELNNDNSLGAITNNISISSLGERMSKIFYIVDNNELLARINVNNSVLGNGSLVEFKKVIIEYQKKQEVDKEICNGIVNFEDGCVLFNERVQAGLYLASSTWDADLTFNDGMGISPNIGLEFEQDSNVLIKVTPDRVCDNWLACRSYIKDEDDNNICFDLGLCDSFNNNGNCDNFVVSKKINQTYPDLISLDSISDMSGYAKVGFQDGSLNSDYYSLGAMEQVGELANVPNGGFEFYGSNSYPIGWNVVGDAWDENKFIVVNNPIQMQVEGIGYPPDGRAFLKYSPSASTMESEFIEVEPNTEYVLSAYINTMNFHPSDGFDAVAAGIRIQTYNASGYDVGQQGATHDISWCEGQDQPWFNGCGFNLELGSDWKKKAIHFKLGNETTKIKIILNGSLWWGGEQCCDLDSDGICPEEENNEFNYYPSVDCAHEGSVESNICTNGVVFSNIVERDSCSGNVYFDDIKLRTALNGKDNWNETQTCKLYPEDDSLSCNYYEDSGKLQKGLLGYCLEYDRYPGNEDACLLWYPVDKVNGEGIEEGAGYSDRMLLYYSTESSINKNAEIRLSANKGYYCILSVNFDGTYDLSCNTDDQNHGEPVVDITSVSQNYWANRVSDGYTDVELDSADNFASLGCNPSSGGLCTAVFSDSFENSQGKNVEYWRLIFVGRDHEQHGNNPDWGIRSIIIPRYQSVEGICYVASDFGYLGSNHYDYNQVAIMGQMPSNYSQDINGFPTKYCNINSPACDRCLRNYIYAQKITKVVTSVGENKYWSGRVYKGSDYELQCNMYDIGLDQTCKYLSDYAPFGSVVSPADTLNIMVNPYEWDGKSDIEGNQPLAYEYPDLSLDEPYQARMGQLHSENTIKRIFAQSYGSWNWNGERYESVGGSDWGPPQNLCTDGKRPTCTITGSQMTATLKADNYFELYVNENLELYGGWNNHQTIVDLLAGENVIAIHAEDGGPNCYGLSGVFEISGNADILTNDGLWKCTSAFPGHDWTSISFNDSMWPLAIISTESDCTDINPPPEGSDWIWAEGGGFNDHIYCRYTFIDSGIEDCDYGGVNSDYCAIKPSIYNIKVNNKEFDNIILNKNGFVNLTFNSKVDSQQLPLVMYAIDWGDNERMSISGVEMNDKQNLDNPHSVYHLYSYWDLKSKNSVNQSDQNTIYCANAGNAPQNYNNISASDVSCPVDSNCCAVQPGVKIRDNWGWCNNGETDDICSAGGYELFSGWIIVSEKYAEAIPDLDLPPDPDPVPDP